MIKDLTQGRPEFVLLKFSLPMFVSVFFQQLYNIADSIVVGNFAASGEDSMAAVGASYPITLVFMAIAVGCNIGCSVIISQLFGAKEYKRMKTAVSTTLITSVIISIILIVAGTIFTMPIMRLIQTPENVFADASLYLQIYIGGFIFQFLYNIFTGIFQALGDSRTPLYFLIGSSLGNISLDLLFVAVFHWDVAGVAWATFIAQGIACILAGVTLYTRMKKIKTEGKISKFSGQLLKKITIVSIPSILQQSFISVGYILIQGIVNKYGSSVVAGYSAAIKLNNFATGCLLALSNAMSSFTAQNIGAGRRDRVKKGFIAGLVLGVFGTLPFAATYFFAGDVMINLFISDVSAEAIETGALFLKIVAPFQFIIMIKIIIDGVFRGSGAMFWFMFSTFTDLLLRVGLAFILPIWFDSTGLWWSWPIGWIAATIVSVVIFSSGKWKKHRLV